MNFLISLLLSITSASFVMRLNGRVPTPQAELLLRQEIQLLENNALRNILREQNLQKRTAILEKALSEIEKLRANSPVQLQKDEKAIGKMVLNLKSLQSLNQALHKEVP